MHDDHRRENNKIRGELSFLINELFSVRGKTAIVTGGSRGIGRMIAEGYVQNGVKTYITARKSGACIATAEQLAEQGECIAIPADLSTKDGREAFIKQVEAVSYTHLTLPTICSV